MFMIVIFVTLFSVGYLTSHFVANIIFFKNDLLVHK